MNSPLVRIMVRSVAEAYPTTGTCRFRNSSGAPAIAAMNSNAAESPATGRLNGRGEPTRPPRNSFNQPRNSCSIRRRSFASGRYALRHRVFLGARSRHLLSRICISLLTILLSRTRHGTLLRLKLSVFRALI